MDAVTLLAAGSFKSQVVPIIGGIGVLSLVIGIAFFVTGLRTNRRRDEFAARATAAPGEVVENVWRPMEGREMTGHIAYPVLRYQLPDGTVLEQESFEGASPPVARKGRAVTVLYEPSNPRLVRIAKDGIAHSVLPVACMVIGVIAASMGALTVAGAIALALFGPDA